MKPSVQLAAASTPDGGRMSLHRHDRDFSIMINGRDLMHSRQSESELELARLGCRHLIGCAAPSILIGGLGMGFTLRQALDMLAPRARVAVAELVDAVVAWNREYFGELNGRPLEDPRVTLKMGDIVALISNSPGQFDAILLDVDNGPDALTDSGNRRLYGREGLQSCRRALVDKGCLAVWSSGPSRKFEHLLMQCGFQVRRFRVPAHKGGKSPSRFIWVAAKDRSILPPGGGEPHPPAKHTPPEKRRQVKSVRKRLMDPSRDPRGKQVGTMKFDGNDIFFLKGILNS